LLRSFGAAGKRQVTQSCHVSRVTCHASRVTRAAFSLVEVLLAMTLLSLIVLALMAVFNSTQTAFSRQRHADRLCSKVAARRWT